MLKWSQAVLLAFHSMAILAGRREDVVTVEEIAGTLDVSADHLSKVMQKLAKSGFVRSVRGPQGGYTLHADPDSVALLDIYECIDGVYVTRDCALHELGCGSVKCIFGNMMGDINKIVLNHLSKTMLSDVASGEVGEMGGI